jgi:hypothetical protein
MPPDTPCHCAHAQYSQISLMQHGISGSPAASGDVSSHPHFDLSRDRHIHIQVPTTAVLSSYGSGAPNVIRFVSFPRDGPVTVRDRDWQPEPDSEAVGRGAAATAG